MLNPQDTPTKTRFKDCHKNSLQYSNQSTEQTLSPQKFQSARTVVTLLKNLINHKILRQSFNLIHRHVIGLKSKQLIYAAIYKKSSSSQNEQNTTKKKRQEIKIETINKQKLEEFLFNNDDISRIIDRSEDNVISNQSRIDLQNLLEIATLENKFITSTHKIHNQMMHEKSQFISIGQKKPQIFKKTQPYIKKQAYLSNNLHFQSYNKTNIVSNDNDVKPKRDKSIKFNVSQTSQTSNSRVHQIYIVRQRSTKSKRANSQPINSKETYIQVPLKYKRVQIIQLPFGYEKQTKYSQSLDSKNCTKTCADNCQAPSIEENCRHCYMVKKSFDILKKLKQPTY